jgi:hypothetical protein
MPKGSARCRANQAYTAFHHGERGLGIGIENKRFFEKTDFFYKLNAPTVAESVHFAYALINKQDLFFNINYIDIIPI